MAHQSLPVAYHTLPGSILVESRAQIAALDLADFEQRFHSEVWPKVRDQWGVLTGSPVLKIRRKGLLGVRNACLWIACEEPEWAYTFGPMQGLALLVPGRQASPPIPVYLTFGTASRSVIRHEQVHLCQFLHPNPLPLTPEERDSIVLSKASDRLGEFGAPSDPVEVEDMAVRIMCWYFWVELEAEYFGLSGQIGDADEFLADVAQSVKPCSRLELLPEGGSYPDGRVNIPERVDQFFREAADRFPWLNDIMVAAETRSLAGRLWDLSDQEATLKDLWLKD